MKAVIETTAGLTEAEAAKVRQLASRAPEYSRLDNYEAFLRVELPAWYVYRGDEHLGLHQVPGGVRFLRAFED